MQPIETLVQRQSEAVKMQQKKPPTVSSPWKKSKKTSDSRSTSFLSAVLGVAPTYLSAWNGFVSTRQPSFSLVAPDRKCQVLSLVGFMPNLCRWTAICRGAVIRGLTSHDLSESLSVKVASRVARQSYGISLSRTWDQAIHLQQDKYWSEHAWKWKARNQMDWFLKQVNCPRAIQAKPLT